MALAMPPLAIITMQAQVYKSQFLKMLLLQSFWLQ